MILRHIQLATFRVVAYIKGDCVELPQFPRVLFSVSVCEVLNSGRGCVVTDVLWCG